MAIIPLPLPVPTTRRRGRLGWGGHLFFLTAWLVALIASWEFQHQSIHHAAPLGSAAGVVRSCAVESAILGVVCAAAWLCSRATAREWRVRWRGGVGPLWRGVLYSFAARIALLVVGLAVICVLAALGVIDIHDTARFRPQVENAVSLPALAHDRAFFWCVVTLLSATAGVSEEIWRGGMLAGLAGVFPGAFGGRIGSWVAILPVAVLFGLGHLYMGWPAVAAATLLGLALGAITVWHGTVWDAAVAHTLFDAGSFALLAWVSSSIPT